MGSPTTAHHCSPLVSSYPILSLSSFSSSLPLTWRHTSKIGLAWPHQEQAPISSTFLAQPQELRATAGPEPEWTHSQTRSIQCLPSVHTLENWSQEKGEASRKPTQLVLETQMLWFSQFCVFSVKFFEPLPPEQSKLSALAVPVLLPVCLPNSLKQSLIPWQDYDPREEALRINVLGLHAFASPSFSDCAFPNLMIWSNLLLKAMEAYGFSSGPGSCC